MSDTGLQVRAYRHTDEHAVVRLWQMVFPDDPEWNEPRAVIRRKLTVQPELFLVALRAGSVVGTTLAGFDGVRGWVHHVAVDPGLRQQGIGRLLMQEAADRLQGLGCPKLNLQVRASSAGAVSFYERLGFVREERISFGQILDPERPPVESLNRAIVRRWYHEMWNGWDLAVADQIADPEIQFRGSLGSTLSGVAALKEYIREVRAAFPDFHNQIEDLLGEADKVVARLTYTGTHRGALFEFPATRRRISYAGVAIFTFRDGRIVEGWVLGDVYGLRKQLRGKDPLT